MTSQIARTYFAGIAAKEGAAALLVPAEMLVSDAALLSQVQWRHVVFDGRTRASPIAVTAAGVCTRTSGATFISDGVLKLLISLIGVTMCLLGLNAFIQ
jgi:hypothetical protein